MPISGPRLAHYDILTGWYVFSANWEGIPTNLEPRAATAQGYRQTTVTGYFVVRIPVAITDQLGVK